MTARRAVWLTAGLYAAALAALVLSPVGRELNELTVRMYGVWNYDLALPGRPPPEVFGFGLNVLLFIPVGILLAVLLRLPWLLTALCCVALSAAVELVQMIPALHRVSSLTDLVANGLGGLVGTLLSVPARHRWGRGR
ncbi:hypothetical protein GCM10011519_27350 [Marmoricola endophyticus]|uniref:VanZ-like domain-containing protein n=1 Tax=Marmoricola endophyticus TaxID=2040280 RepID=A0A917BQ54_9ACTN|nr:VanZ family protein [Marmoricola endophyticus]GGF51844.1 hypothetical protein GCM10011519_27350 [Marmoricola endophyticus]